MSYLKWCHIYVVRELKIADYIFFVGEKLAPVLIERKTADDVAGSLHDGRWERQQRSMRKAQYVLGGGSARRCQVSSCFKQWQSLVTTSFLILILFTFSSLTSIQ